MPNSKVRRTDMMRQLRDAAELAALPENQEVPWLADIVTAKPVFYFINTTLRLYSARDINDYWGAWRCTPSLEVEWLKGEGAAIGFEFIAQAPASYWPEGYQA